MGFSCCPCSYVCRTDRQTISVPPSVSLDREGLNCWRGEDAAAESLPEHTQPSHPLPTWAPNRVSSSTRLAQDAPPVSVGTRETWRLVSPGHTGTLSPHSPPASAAPRARWPHREDPVSELIGARVTEGEKPGERHGPADSKAAGDVFRRDCASGRRRASNQEPGQQLAASYSQ